MLFIRYLCWASVLMFRLDMSIIMAEGPKYDTAYACDGKMLKIECKEGDVINLIRANYGRFSIVVCNDHGSTEWSVNCMSHKSFTILQTRCSQKRNCSIQANTSLFGDPCPGTVKYLEAHYHCVSATSSSSTHRPAPPWLMTSQPSVWSTAKSLTVVPDIVAPATPSTVSTEKVLSSSSLQPEKDEEASSDTVPLSAQVTSESKNVAVQTTTELQSFSTDSSVRMLSDDKAPLCEPTSVRNLNWNWTYGGEIAVKPCPSGVDGLARWRCQVISKNIAIRFPETPDLSDCKSIWLTSLGSRMIDGDTILKIASDLVQVTDSKTLYGGDIIITCKIIRDMVQRMSKDLPTFSDPRQREAAVFDLLRSVVKIANHLLDISSLPSWLDLAYKEQMQMASSLLIGLEENSFLLATTFFHENVVTHCHKNIILQVQVLESRNVGDVIFPSALGSGCRMMTSNYVQLRRSSLIENGELGIIRVLYVAFDSLESILKTQSVGKEEKRINSKVLSASLGRGRHIQLNHPVTLCFEHLQTENVSNPSCVFWDYTQNMWSEEGCMLVSTNKTHSICQCNHLTNFAILVDFKPSNYTHNEFSVQSILLLAVIAVIVAFVVVFVVYRYFKSVKTRKEYGSFVQDSVWITKCFVCCQPTSTTCTTDPEKTLSCKDPRPALYGNTATANNINAEDITIQPTHHHIVHHNLSTHHHASNTLPRSFMNENGIPNHYPSHAATSGKMNHYPTYNSRNGSIRKIKEARHFEHIENALQHRNRKLSATTARSSSPRSHTYSEIAGATGGGSCRGGDPVYEEIEREKEHCSQVSDISDEDGKKHSDMSRQSSKSYGDHRPLIPYNAVTDRAFHVALDSAFRCQLKEQSARTVSVLDGQTVVCHLQSPDTRMYNKTMGHSSHHY